MFLMLTAVCVFRFPKTNKRILQLEQRKKDGSEKLVDSRHKGEEMRLYKSSARIDLVRGAVFWSDAALGLWTVLC